MPEGDTIFRTAEVLRRALQDRAVARFDTTVATVAAVDARSPVAGRVVCAVVPRGKHLLMTFAPPAGVAPGAARPAGDEPPGADDPTQLPGALTLHTHMMMTGSWHIYRPGEPWRKPARRAVVVVHTDAFVAPCFSAPVVELLTPRQVAQHPRLGGLGPDASAADFDLAEARARLRRRPEQPIGVALLNQRVLAGVGNVFKSELLFRARVSPFRKVAELSDAQLEALLADSHRLLRDSGQRPTRRTVAGPPRLRPERPGGHDDLYVYGRGGEPCRLCGEAIRVRRQGLDARSTYFCPRCQEVA